MFRLIQSILFIFSFVYASAQTSERYAEHSVLAEGKWVKIRVENAGMYQITNSTLRSMGFSNPDNVRLYGLNLEVLPESNIESIDDDLVELPLYRTDSKVLFYGRGQTQWTLNTYSTGALRYTHFNNPYSNYTYYFLTENTSSEPIELEKYAYNVGTDAEVLTSFPEHALIENDAFSFLYSGRIFFDSYDFASGNTKSYTLQTPDIVADRGIDLVIQFCAAGSSSSQLGITMNDSTLGTISYSALSNYEYGRLTSRTYTVGKRFSKESNTIRLQHTRTSGVSGRLDYIRASYERQLRLSSQELLFRPKQKGDVIFRLSGGSDETVVLHINSATGYEELNGTYNTSSRAWDYPFSSDAISWYNEEFVAFNPSATFPSPHVVGAIANQDLHSLSNIDLVIVIPASGNLTQQAQRLADAHTAADGMSCVVVSADKIYNEFSSGAPDATAIRRFMKMLFDKAPDAASRPKNLLLFGDCVWDNRMITSAMSGYKPDNYLLCYEGDNSLSHTNSFVLEEYFTLVADNASADVLRAKPLIGVGRIPVTTTSEAKDVVDKLITYINNEQVGAWKNTIAVLCDDGNNNQHMEDGDTLIGRISPLYPNIHIQRVYWDTYARERSTTGNSYPGAYSNINRIMQEGALVMNYTGHGAAYCLSHEQILRTSDFANWSSPHLPLWVTAACDVAPFDMNQSNIGEVALLNPKGAAMGILSTSRTVYPAPNSAINWRFMIRALGNKSDGSRYTLGEALADAKCNYIDTYNNSTYNVNKAHFVLLGDPAITLASPTPGIEIDLINSTYAPGSPMTIAAGETVTIEGHIVGEDGNVDTEFNGVISPVIYDNEETVICKNNPYGESNGNTNETPYQFTDRVRTLYTCADSVRQGKFKFVFPMPLDNNYSGQSGLVSLYAANDSHSNEVNGRFDNFLINGTSPTLQNDTEGPVITAYLNTEHFKEGDVVNETPLLIATFQDESGINMTGSGIGHDISVVIDNDEAQTYSLNAFFSPTIGDYRSGSVAFSIPELSDGHHTMSIRAFDALNNASQKTIDFFVNQGEQPEIFDMTVTSPAYNQITLTIENDRPQTNISVNVAVYSVAGHKVYETSESGFSSSASYTLSRNFNEMDSHLPPGVYILNAKIGCEGGKTVSKALKFVILSSKAQ